MSLSLDIFNGEGGLFREGVLKTGEATLGYGNSIYFINLITNLLN